MNLTGVFSGQFAQPVGRLEEAEALPEGVVVDEPLEYRADRSRPFGWVGGVSPRRAVLLLGLTKRG